MCSLNIQNSMGVAYVNVETCSNDQLQRTLLMDVLCIHAPKLCSKISSYCRRHAPFLCSISFKMTQMITLKFNLIIKNHLNCAIPNNKLCFGTEIPLILCLRLNHCFDLESSLPYPLGNLHVLYSRLKYLPAWRI